MQNIVNVMNRKVTLAVFEVGGKAAVTDRSLGFVTESAMGAGLMAVVPVPDWNKDGRTALAETIVANALPKATPDLMSEGMRSLAAAVADMLAAAPLDDVTRQKIAGAVRGSGIRVAGPQIKLIGGTGATLAAFKCANFAHSAEIQVAAVRKLAGYVGAAMDSVRFGVSEHYAVVGFPVKEGGHAFQVIEVPKKEARPEEAEPAQPKPAAPAAAKDEGWTWDDILAEVDKAAELDRRHAAERAAQLGVVKAAVKAMAKERVAAERDAKALIELARKLGGAGK